MDPIAGTRDALAQLSRFSDVDLTARYDAVARLVASVAPACVGVTFSLPQEGLAFSWVVRGVDVTSLDAVQFADHAWASEGQRLAAGSVLSSDPLDESTWRLSAMAANAAGVRSTLSIPVLDGDAVVAIVSLYGRTLDAFEGRLEALAAVCSGWPAGAITNADLSLSEVQRAKGAPKVLEERWTIDLAVGTLMGAHRVSADTARQHLRETSARQNISEAELASILVGGRDA